MVDAGVPRARVAAMASTSLPTVRHWTNVAHDTGCVDDAPRSGQPRVTDAHDDAAIVRASQLDHWATAHDIRNQLCLPISVDTIERRLIDAGLPTCVAARKHLYSEEDKKLRLSFARGYLEWTDTQWEDVIFSDETIGYGQGRRTHRTVHRPAGHRYDDEYIADTVAHPPQKYIFACFCAGGPGQLFFQDHAFDGPTMVAALREALMPTARRYFDVAHAQRWWLLHDNLPLYRKGLVVRRWVFGKGIQELVIPPRSPDLNPIENSFAHMRRAVDKHFPTTAAEVEAAWRAEWAKLPHTLHSALALSMRERCAAVIAAGGGATCY
jgi:hypothetical protein